MGHKNYHLAFEPGKVRQDKYKEREQKERVGSTGVRRYKNVVLSFNLASSQQSSVAMDTVSIEKDLMTLWKQEQQGNSAVIEYRTLLKWSRSRRVRRVFAQNKKCKDIFVFTCGAISTCCGFSSQLVPTEILQLYFRRAFSPNVFADAIETTTVGLINALFMDG
ncbi:unnamed protein product [Enterobius vermicularis]|uniref:Na_Ca_ex domain-containing protein n=1 Tax=Enterobius vermicularis TaxID=51028 RepID=A0A0N4VCF6_ENTVE|nr:unnamed protein product [Enterobius vermicularis]